MSRGSPAPGHVDVSSGRLIRNSLLDIAGQGFPLVVGLVSVPVIVHGLGTERFGLLVFTWTLFGVLSAFDFGLGWSVTKFVAEALGRGDRAAVPAIIWTAAAGQAVAGVIGAAAVVAGAGLLVTRVLTVAPEIQVEGMRAFQIAGLSFPVMLVTQLFRGTAEAAQRFDISATFKSVASSTVFLVPLAGVFFHWELPGILGVLLGVRVLLLVILMRACVRALAVRTRFVVLDKRAAREVFAFGGWVMAAALAGMVLTYADRLVIGNALTMTSLTHYTVPQELISRLGLFAATLAAVLLPAFSALGGEANDSRRATLLRRSGKYIVLVVIPVFIPLAVFAREILHIWLGPTLAEAGAGVLRILTVGAAFQVIGVVPSSVIRALGRPDLIAKLYMFEVPLFAGASWWLVGPFGISGVALAWSGRLVLHVLLLVWTAHRMGLWSWRSHAWDAGRLIMPVALLSVGAALIHAAAPGLFAKAVLMAGLLTVFYLWVWTTALGADERRQLLGALPGWRGDRR